MIVHVFTGKDIKENEFPINPDEVEFVTLHQFEAVQDNMLWLVKHALESGCISKAKAAELLFTPLIDLDVVLEAKV